MQRFSRRFLNQWTGLQMTRLTYLLILLLLSAQVDDAWTVDPALPSASLADDNDEYLPAPRRPRDELSASAQGPMFVGLKPPPTNACSVPAGVRSEWNVTAPFTPPPLYVFMSLQI
jgi:hypothetical protein